MALAGCCSPRPYKTVVARYIKEGIVGSETFAVDASIIVADAQRRLGAAKVGDLDPTSNLRSPNICRDLKHAVITDVGATTAIRQAEVGAAKTRFDRTAEQFEVSPRRAWSPMRAMARPRWLGGWWTSVESSRT